MTPANLRQRLLAGEPVFGTLIVSPSPHWPEAVRSCGLDFVFIDTEHIALDRAQLSWMCHTYATLGLPPLVRITSPDPCAATMVLDGGAAGVAALNALDAILAALIGPNDLSCSLGLPERYDHPEFLAACETIFRKARSARLGAGIHFWGGVDQHVRFLQLGANLLIHSADITLFQKHLRTELGAVKQAAGLISASSDAQSDINI